MQIILPKEAENRQIDFYSFCHPQTNKPAKFLVDLLPDAPHKLYELTVVGDGMHTSMIGDQMFENGNLVVATPLHPLFLVIPTLYNTQHKAYPLDIVLDLASTCEGTQVIPEPLISPFIEQITNNTNEKVLLDIEKLKNFLDLYTQRVRAGLPASIKQEIVNSVEINENPKLTELAEIYGAVSMVATSWLSDDVAEWFLDTYDFTQLLDEAKKLEEKHRIMDLMNEPSKPVKRTASKAEPKKKAKQPKVIKADNNRSIVDMFKKK